MKEQISKHIFEVRYKPNPSFLDKRGSITAQIIGGRFDNWSISNNKIDFVNSKTNEVSAFFSYANFGVITIPPVTKDDFLSISEEFIKSAWQFFDTSTITRMGVRSIFLVQVKDFTKLFEAYKNKFLGLPNDDLSSFGGDLIDVGFPLNFVNGDNFFNVVTGPMQKEQSKNIFGDEAFDAGFYLEVDYFTKEISPHIIQKRVISFIDEGVSKAVNLTAGINKIVKI